MMRRTAKCCLPLSHSLGGSGLAMFEVGRAINGLGVGAGTLVGPM